MSAAVITSATEAVALLANAAPYAEFVLVVERAGRRQDIRLMARDYPRPGRRCTDLTHGTEWLNMTPESLQRVGFVEISEATA